MDGRKRKKK